MKSILALSGPAILLLAGELLHAQSPWPSFAPPPLAPQSQEEAPSYNLVPLTTGEDPLAGLESDCKPVPIYHAWISFDFMLADIELDDGEASYWTTESTLVSRNEVSIQGPEGYGVRAQIWSIEKEFDLGNETLEARVATFYLDGFRQFVGENGELSLGGGLAYGSLKTDSSFADSVHRFNGLGASLAGEGFYPLVRFEKTDFGVTGHARLAVLGPLQDNFDNSEAMLVDELGVGLELRRRWGKHENKLWFVRVSRDYQHWSDISAPFAADQTVQGTSLKFGFAW